MGERGDDGRWRPVGVGAVVALVLLIGCTRNPEPPSATADPDGASTTSGPPSTADTGAVLRSARVPEVRVQRVARRVLAVVAVGAIGLTGAACSDDESTIDPDTPVSAVDAEVVDGGDEAPTSPGTLTVTGVDDGGAGGSDPAAPDGQVPDRSTVPPATAGAGGGADGGDPPDVSTRPSG